MAGLISKNVYAHQMLCSDRAQGASAASAQTLAAFTTIFSRGVYDSDGSWLGVDGEALTPVIGFMGIVEIGVGLMVLIAKAYLRRLECPD